MVINENNENPNQGEGMQGSVRTKTDPPDLRKSGKQFHLLRITRHLGWTTLLHKF
jgi:hypothetical protein